MTARTASKVLFPRSEGKTLKLSSSLQVRNIARVKDHSALFAMPRIWLLSSLHECKAESGVTLVIRAWQLHRA